MPANRDELAEWCERSTTCYNSAAYAAALARDCGPALLYGPAYRRCCWENFADAVRSWTRGDYAAAYVHEHRARFHAGHLTADDLLAILDRVRSAEDRLEQYGVPPLIRDELDKARSEVLPMTA